MKLTPVAGAGSGKVVGVDGPGHDAGQPLIVGELRLLADGNLVVVTDPLDAFAHVGGLEDVNIKKMLCLFYANIF